MLRLSLTWPSRALLTTVKLEIGLPGGLLAAQPPWKTVWALHPAMGDGGIFFEALNCAGLVDKYGFALVAPSLGNGYFVNSPFQRQADFLDEMKDYLPDILPLMRQKDANTALGISMGGFGAVRWGLASGAFANIVAISGVFDPKLAPDERLFKNRGQKALFKALHRIMLERLLDKTGSTRPDANIEMIMNRFDAIKPQIWLYCGEGDYLSNQQTKHMEKLCEQNGYECHADFSKGEHNSDYWRTAFENAMEFIIKQETVSCI